MSCPFDMETPKTHVIPRAGDLEDRGEAERSSNWNRKRADLVDRVAKTLQHSHSLSCSGHSNPGNRPDSVPAKFPNPTSFSLNTTTTISVTPSCCCHRAQSTAPNPHSQDGRLRKSDQREDSLQQIHRLHLLNTYVRRKQFLLSPDLSGAVIGQSPGISG